MMTENINPLIVFFADTQAINTASLRGSKGLSLAIMHQLGMPVPPGFTITTSVARHLMCHDGEFPPTVVTDLYQAMAALERETGRRYGDTRRPLLVSARSGAFASMPGMMDTILNIGLTAGTYPGLVAYGGAQFAEKCRKRLHSMFNDIVGIPPPDDPWEQLLVAIKSVFHSWNNPHARVFREWSGLDHSCGTAVTIQSMVFGNLGLGSGTGVARSHDVNTGMRQMCGEYLSDAQGDDIVSGKQTPLDLSSLRNTLPDIYSQLEEYVVTLGEVYNAPVETEFTVESGVLYLLQCRNAVLSPTGAAVRAVQLVNQGAISKEKGVALLSQNQIEHLIRASRFNPDTLESAKMNDLLGTGLAASSGIAVGRVAFDSAYAMEMAKEGTPVILVRPSTDPSDLPGMLAANGIVTETGGFTSHGAVVANSQRKPAVVGTGGLKRQLVEGEWISIDASGTAGFVFAGKLPSIPFESENEVKTFLEWVRSNKRQETGKRSIDPKWLTEKIKLNSVYADFYLTWAMAREAMGTDLEVPLENLRCRVHSELASAMTCYLTAAIIREFNDSQTRGTAYVCARDDLNWIESRCNAFAGTYLLTKIVKNISSLNLLDQAGFFHHSASIFRKGYWEIAFCGEPWAVIADIVAAYLEGVIPDDTTFVDQVFNLQHHGGRLFDKHPLVKNEFSNEAVLRRQLNVNLNVTLIQELFEKVCFPNQCERDIGFLFAPSEDVMNGWRQGLRIGLWNEREANVAYAPDPPNISYEKLHEPHRGTPVAIGPFTIYAAGIHDIGTDDLAAFRSDTNAILVLLSDDQIEWRCNATDFTILAKPLVDHGGVPDDWKAFIQKLFDLLVAGKRLLITCSKGHGRTGCCIASLIAYIESSERTPDPIAATRIRHCWQAIESRNQAEAIFAIRNERLPTRYWPLFPEIKKKFIGYDEIAETEFAP